MRKIEKIVLLQWLKEGRAPSFPQAPSREQKERKRGGFTWPLAKTIVVYLRVLSFRELPPGLTEEKIKRPPRSGGLAELSSSSALRRG